jgi:hypothetical protein
LHSHSHHQHHNNMSTLTPSEVGTSSAEGIVKEQRDQQLPHHAAPVPRSVLNEGALPDRRTDISHASSLLSTRGYHSLNIDIPLDTSSSMSMELTHDGKVTELVARFESITGSGSSDESQVLQDDSTSASSMSTQCDSVPDFSTLRASHSPRKRIPAQWLPTSSGPTLATAQRVRERGQKHGSASGSPVEAKILHGTRSSVDLRKAHIAEGATFLTKEALAAVESNIVSPASARSPKKHQPTTKPAWWSPTSPSSRNSPRQQSTLTIKMSPTRTTFLSAGSTSLGHRRGASSVATSNEDPLYHTAENSPVRSHAGSEHSFTSAAEVIDDDIVHVYRLDLSADSELEQAPHESSLPRVPANKAATIGRFDSSKPKLSVKIPPTDPRLNIENKSSNTTPSATSGSDTGVDLWSPVSPSLVSRIPRAAAPSATVSARSPTRSSVLKQTQSPKSAVVSKTKPQKSQSQTLDRLPQASIAANVRHVRTLDSSGTTPIIARHHKIDNDMSSEVTASSTSNDGRYLQADRVQAEHLASLLEETYITIQAEPLPQSSPQTSSQVSRASSVSTIKASLAANDPVSVDPAIIYSRKSSDASGMLPQQSFHVPQIIVMMTHLYDTGTFHMPTVREKITPVLSNAATASTHTALSVRGRTKDIAPVNRRQGESVHSLQSCSGSDLRATAPVFVPLTAQASPSKDPEATPTSLIDSSTDLLGAKAFELDQFGIPWFYYMNQVQLAYTQGFQNGRAKSPRKFRNKKQRSSVSSPDVQPPHHDTAIPIRQPISEAAPESVPDQRRGSANMPPPASTVPLVEQRVQKKRRSSSPVEATTTSKDDVADTDRPYSPFASQKAIIARQTAEITTSSTPRDHMRPIIDLTTIRNVPLPSTPRIPPQHGKYNNRYYRNRHSDNGLYNYTYNGRGSVGMPMHATMPFPDPVPPQGRPIDSQGPYVGYTVPVGSEACGMVDITLAAEKVGGEACNVCLPDH